MTDDGGRRTASGRPPLELWGGHECTVNRVGDRWFDQTVRTGHEHRIGDLDLFAGLGIKAIRYPVLWERIAPERPDARDWRWTDERLGRLRELGLRPIAGLVHHGSGPRYTDLLDEGFAAGLAVHARATAERYPWLDAYTPVNEPLTTARFAGQYGHWHPHRRDEHAFLHALVNEVEATILAMREIRAVNPAAQLVQTEDLGHVFATDPLAHQAAFENERRWLSFDLLCGRVTPDHLMWRFMEANGLADRVLRLNDAPCPPDVVGLNSYLSSERFLDHRLDMYSPDLHGGNGRERYADVEAVRAVLPGVMGLERLLLAAHARYALPLAVTEAHNGCTREEQVRWLTESWRACEAARAQGADVRALTAWSLLGAVDWSNLLTRDEGAYEPGVFDVRSGVPRETALAAACRRLARGDTDLPDGVQGPGWWSRDIRLSHPATWAGQQSPVRRTWTPPAAPRRPVLVTGATGTLGRALGRALEHRGHAYVLADRALLPLDDARAMADALDAVRPWAVVNAAGYVRVDDAEGDADACLEANGHGVERLARACAGRGLPLLTFSSDLVFDGTKRAPYLEDDATAPLNVYGASKALAEAAVRAHGGLIVRTAAFFSPLDPHNFAHAVAQTLSRGHAFRAASDQVVSPTYVADLVDAALDLMIDGATGVAHLANAGATSWAGFARDLARALGLDGDLVEDAPGAALGQVAARPAHAALASRYGALLPPLEDAVARYAAAVRPTLKVAPARFPVDRPRRTATREV